MSASPTVYVALDLEATEMHPERGEIIELGAIKFTPERIVDRWSATVRPRGPIPFAITQLTGITEAEVRRAAPFAAVAPALAAFVRQHPIVGQSAWMDVDMLRAAGLTLANPVLDTFELATLTLPSLPAYSLRQIAGRLGVALPVEHRALADAAVTVEVFRRLLARIRELDAETLGEMARLLGAARSPLAPFWRELAREKTREGFDAPLGGALAGALRRGLADKARAVEPASGVGPESLFLLPRERPERLEPTGKGDPIDPARLRAIFAPGGPFARAFPGFEQRPQQLAMMEAVADTLNDGGTLIAEAGTGVGKSLAYLLPAVIHAVTRGETVVISTATINLQDQLFRKDIPDLQHVLATLGDDERGATSDERRATSDDQGATGEGDHDPIPQSPPKGYPVRDPQSGAPVPPEFRAALLKGRSNYLCLRRWFNLRRGAQGGAEDAAMAHLLAKTLIWVQETDSGDRAELLLLPDEQAGWGRLAEHEGSCVASQCVFQKRGQCFLYRARRGAESAHVVVVNHALLLSDLGTDGGILPPYRHLIIDEAHGLEAEATRQLGFEVDAPRLALHLDALGRAEGTRGEGRRARSEEARGGGGDPLGELRARLNVTKGKAAREAGDRVDEAAAQARAAVATAREAGAAFFTRLAAFVARHAAEGGGYDQRLRLIDDLRTADDWREVETAWDDLHAPLLTIGEALTTTLLALDAVGEELEGREDIIMELTLALRANAEIRLHAGAAVARPDPGMVYWIEAGGGTGGGAGRIGLHAAPLHVGQALREGLFGPKRSTILTSATLATEGSFAFIRERLGLADDEAVRELRVPSPFDYASNVLLLLPDDIPEPGAPNHQKGLNEALIRLCAATEGRALVLFTSYNALQTTYRAIKAPLERAGVLVLGQRIDGGPRQILDRFRSNPGTVLLGTSSFWEGVDVVGDALSTLVITRLPFAVPTDPVFAARSEGFADPFGSFAVPGAILRFKQGFGRLIRSAEDRGVCAILDRRVLSKRYGRGFIASLPPCAEWRGPLADLGTTAADWLDTRPAPSRE